MRSVELFAGAGGLGIGVSKAGFGPLAVIEWDRYCCDTIRRNQHGGLKPLVYWPLIEGDVRNFNFSSIGAEIDLVSGGPPCQPFSICGKHRGYLDTRDMFPQAIRAVRELRPRAFVFENVKGLTRSAFSSYFRYIWLHLKYPSFDRANSEDWWEHLARLERYDKEPKEVDLCYHVVSRVLNAADYGIPQKRERVFIVGFRSDLEIEWNPPPPTHSRLALSWAKSKTGDYWDRHHVARKHRCATRCEQFQPTHRIEQPPLMPWRTVRDAIADLPDPELAPRSAAEYPNHRFQPGARPYPGHTGSPLDEPAKTLKAGDHGVPGGENMLLRDDGSVRYFSVRESARLQTFADDFLFDGSWSETMRQLGNAVPVTLAKVVAKSIADQLKHRCKLECLPSAAE